MKKGFSGLAVTSIASIIFGMFFLSIQATSAATPELDQSYEFAPDSSNGYIMVKTWGQVCQMFLPTKDNFANYLDLYISDGVGSSATASLMTHSGSLPDTVLDTFISRASAAEGFDRFNNSDGIATAITANEPHWICLDAGNNTQLKWHSRNTGYYNDGYAINKFPDSPNTYPNTDLGFKTYGYDDDPPPGGEEDTTPIAETTSEASGSCNHCNWRRTWRNKCIDYASDFINCEIRDR